MRNIKFKAKDISDKWVYGYYHVISDPDMGEHYYYIMNDSTIDCAIDPLTVCEFTGLTDSNEEDIYEHDFLDIDGLLYEVVWIDGGFKLKSLLHDDYYYPFNRNRIRDSIIVDNRF